jgi:hypothetical protein
MDFEKYTDRAKGFVQAAQSLALREVTHRPPGGVEAVSHLLGSLRSTFPLFPSCCITQQTDHVSFSIFCSGRAIPRGPRLRRRLA